jgi:hypothetical protein
MFVGRFFYYKNGFTILYSYIGSVVLFGREGVLALV